MRSTRSTRRAVPHRSRRPTTSPNHYYSSLQAGEKSDGTPALLAGSYPTRRRIGRMSVWTDPVALVEVRHVIERVCSATGAATIAQLRPAAARRFRPAARTTKSSASRFRRSRTSASRCGSTCRTPTPRPSRRRSCADAQQDEDREPPCKRSSARVTDSSDGSAVALTWTLILGQSMQPCARRHRARRTCRSPRRCTAKPNIVYTLDDSGSMALHLPARLSSLGSVLPGAASAAQPPCS